MQNKNCRNIYSLALSLVGQGRNIQRKCLRNTSGFLQKQIEVRRGVRRRFFFESEFALFARTIVVKESLVTCISSRTLSRYHRCVCIYVCVGSARPMSRALCRHRSSKTVSDTGEKHCRLVDSEIHILQPGERVG